MTVPAAAPSAGSDAAADALQATRRLMWLLMVPMMVLLAVLTALQYGQRMGEAERDLLRHANERAQELESLARPAVEHVSDLRAWLEQRWNDPPDAGPALRAALGERRDDNRLDGWSLDGADEAGRAALGQFWWAPVDVEPPAAAWLHRASGFIDLARAAYRREPIFVATWFACAEVNASFGYPWIPTERMMRSMGVASLQALEPIRHQGFERVRRELERDPNDITFWGSPYVSQLDGRLVMSHGAAVVVDGVLRGEVSVDIPLAELQQRIDRWKSGDTRSWVIDRRLNVLADTRQPLQAPAREGQGDARMHVPLADRLPAGLTAADLDRSFFEPDAVSRGDGWVLVAAVRIGSPWTYVLAVPEPALRAGVLPTLVPNALLGAALLLTFVVGQWVLARSFVRPSIDVLDYLRRLSLDPAAPPPALSRRWRGWIDAVTDTFSTQRALQARERQTEALKAAIIDHAINGIVSTDAEGRIVEFNPAAQAMFGVSREAVLGRPVGEVIVPPRMRDAHSAGMHRVAHGGAPRVMDRRVQMPALRADGSELTVEMVLFRTELDGVVHYTASLSDMTDRLQAAEQIERQRDALRQSEKLTAMGSLLAGVAHELNNPLAIVMGRASLLEEKTEGTPLAGDAVRIREAAERCGRIVRTFLNMARQKPVDRRPVQLNDLARAAAEMLGYTLRSHGIDLALTLADGLPEVAADGDQIGQVVLNLIVNAQQALVTTEAPRHIGVQTGLDSGVGDVLPRVWLRVSDNGPGVPPAVRERIFDPFFTTKPEGSGTGLGLSVSRSIVHEHGGHLVLETAAGDRGASFRLSLPTGDGAPGAPPPGAPMQEDAASARVLVVDDEAEIADLLRTMLENAGYEVATAESGAVALELLEAASFDAIVSDLRMPDIDGAALWREVQRRHAALATRMLFVTGDTLSPGASRFLAESGCGCLDKPFARADLIARVRALVGTVASD